ncbi:unnamed protein product [Moneuplotes crassus]|uniref:Transmembrane protein n=1 Tax=Euplotes crassus TaxID=5936 RepID=A0AAD2D7Q5_EUPCR|nr:unnamed protein product [Moneuplotes crassus]
MEYYSHPTQDQPILKNSFLPRVANFVAIAVQGYLAYNYYHLSGIFNTNFLAAHALVMFWSIAYHVLPFLTHNICFRSLARMFAYIILFIAFAFLYLFAVTEHQWGPEVYYALLVYFLGPAAFLSMTLIWVMNSDTRQPIDDSLQMPYNPEVMIEAPKKMPKHQVYAMI